MTKLLASHLSGDELFECLAVGATKMQRAHLEMCESCATVLQRNEMMIAGARSAISNWTNSLQCSDAAFLKQMGERRKGRRHLRLAQLSAAVLLVLLVPAALVERRYSEKQRRQADEILLMQVDAALQESEPHAMQPLAMLVSWREDGKQGSGQQEQPRIEEKK
jgi:hypothetical protein